MKKVFFVLCLVFIFVPSTAKTLDMCDFTPCPNTCQGVTIYGSPGTWLLYDSMFNDDLKCFCENEEGKLAAVELVEDVDGTIAAVEFFCRIGFGLQPNYLLSYFDYEPYDDEAVKKIISISCKEPCWFPRPSSGGILIMTM